MMSLRVAMPLALILAIGAIVVLGGIGRAQPSSVDAPLPAALAQNSPISSRLGIVIPEKDAMMAVVGMKQVVLSANRVEAKLMTWSDLEAVRGKTYGQSPYEATRPVWVIAVGGKVRPQFAHGDEFSWAVFVADARTGLSLATFAEHDGTWPRYFDRVPNSAPAP